MIFVLSLLGPFQARLDEKVIQVRSLRVKGLLAYLAVESGHPVQREAMMELLWPGIPRKSAQISLRQSLYQLSQLIPSLPSKDGTGSVPFVVADRQSIQLNPNSSFELDVARFLTLLNEPTEANLSKAAALYRGGLLADIYLPDSSEFEEWAAPYRAELQRLALTALERLVQISLDQNDYTQAERYARRQLALDNLRESAYRQLMTALARSGQRNAALNQFHACRQILSSELDVQPAAETRDLYEQIRAGEPDSKSPAEPGLGSKLALLSRLAVDQQRYPLPAPTTVFVGRERELAAIAERVAAQECRLLTLVGPGGCGKTRLALEAAEKQIANFSQGVCFIPLASLPSAQSLTTAIAENLGFSFGSHEGLTRQLLNYLRPKKLLMVLDNFEHLVEGAGLLSEILQQAPDVKLLVTSRYRLNLPGEWVIEVEGLPYPLASARPSSSQEGEQKAGIESFPAVQLFLQSARRQKAHFQPREGEFSCIGHICRLVDGLPLAIELAAGWLPALTCQEIASEIQKSLDMLTTARPDVDERHASARAVFQQSWKLLSPEEQGVLRRLSVFRGGFRREAAEMVAGGRLFLLARLIDKSLLRRRSDGYYDLHELLHQFAEEELAASGELEATHNCHLDFYLRLAEAVEIGDYARQQVSGVNQLEADHDNLRAALQWALVQEKAELAARLAGALGWFWKLRGNLKEGRQWMEAVLAVRQGAPAPAIAKVLSWAGRYAYIQGDYSSAKHWYEESLALWQALGDRQNIAWSLNFLGNITRMQGDIKAGLTQCEDSLALFREIENEPGIAAVLVSLSFFVRDMGGMGREPPLFAPISKWSLGFSESNTGDLGTAAALLEESLTLLRRSGDITNLTSVLHNLGIISFLRRDYPRSAAILGECLALAQEQGDQRMVSLCLVGQGDIALHQGQFSHAASYLLQALDMARDLGDEVGITWSLKSLGELAFLNGELDRAAANFEESLALDLESGDTGSQILAFNMLGNVARHKKEPARAKRYYKESLKLCRNKPRHPRTAWALAGIAFAAGNEDQAACGARMIGAADRLFEEIQWKKSSFENAEYERSVEAVRSQLNAATYTAAWVEGRAMTIEQAINNALAED